MIRNEAKMLALQALRRKLRKMELEDEVGVGEENMVGELDSMEKGVNNQAEDAREMGETEAAADGEDGEKEVSIEIEAEGLDEGSMADLYERMKAEMGAEPPSRAASGQKKGFLGGMSGGKMEGKRRGK
jgi:hypothetical protein